MPLAGRFVPKPVNRVLHDGVWANSPAALALWKSEPIMCPESDTSAALAGLTITSCKRPLNSHNQAGIRASNSRLEAQRLDQGRRFLIACTGSRCDHLLDPVSVQVRPGISWTRRVGAFI